MTTLRLHSSTTSHQVRVALAFAAIYLIWGSTFLAIRFAIETIPPFLMGGLRFVAAGLVLYAWSRIRGQERPGKTALKPAIIIGALMVMLGNGLVIWAEQYVPSGLAAVMVATGPMWLVLIDWWTSGRHQLPGSTILGLVIGFSGVVALTFQGSSHTAAGNETMLAISAVLIVVASFSWAGGSIYARRVGSKVPLTMMLGLQMMAGGLMLIVLGTVLGEWGRLSLTTVSVLSAASLLYLIVMGTLVAYSAYQWLMTVSEPAKVATHGYVNPIVAVFLGWAIVSEPLTGGMLVAIATILAGVGLINLRKLPSFDGLWRRFAAPKLTNNPELAMIARTWQGVVPSHKADAYYEYLRESGLHAFDTTAGNRGYYVLRKAEGTSTRFMIVSLWDSMEAIKGFAGDDPDAARFFPEDDDYLIEKETCAEHYEVIGPVM